MLISYGMCYIFLILITIEYFIAVREIFYKWCYILLKIQHDKENSEFFKLELLT